MPTTVLGWIGLTADFIAIIGVPWALIKIYRAHREYKKNRATQEAEERRKNQEIKITLKEKQGNRKICLPNKIRRGELTRAEVLGRLGMIPMIPDPETPKVKQPRFEMRRNATEQFIRDIDALHVATEVSDLIINCESEEMDQFDIAEVRKLGFELMGFDT